MKRELIQNVMVQPYSSGDSIEREGFLSAILAVRVGTTGALTVTVTHGDADTAAEAVTDKLVFPETHTTGGVYTIDSVTAGGVVNIDVDLLGLKNFVKLTLSGAAAANSTAAIALGDKNVQAV